MLAFVILLVAVASFLPSPSRAAGADRLYAACFNGSYDVYPLPWMTAPDNGTGKVYLYLLDAATGQPMTGISLDEPAYFMAVSPSGKRLCLTNGQSRNVTVVNADLTTVGKIPLNTSPHGIAFSPDSSLLYAALPAERMVVAIDVLSGQVRSRVALDTPPYYVAVSHDGRRIFTSNTLNDSFTAIDAIGMRPLTTVATGTRPMDIIVPPEVGDIYVAMEGDDSIYVYDIANYPLKEIISNVKAPSYLAYNPGERRLYATSFMDGNVTAISATADYPADLWPTTSASLGRPAVSGDGSRVLVPEGNRGIAAINATSAVRIGTINFTGPVTAIAMYAVPPDQPIYVSPTPAPVPTLAPTHAITPAPGSLTGGAGVLSSKPWSGKISIRPITQNDVLFILLIFIVILVMLASITYFMMFRPREKE